MKTRFGNFSLMILSCTLAAAALLLGGSGCTTLDKAYDTEVVEQPGGVIATNEIATTNFAVIATTEAGAVVTNTTAVREVAEALADSMPGAVVQELVTRRFELVVAPPTYVTNLVPKPLVKSGIGATGFIPGYGGVVSIGLGWLYAAYAAFRNRQVKKGLILSVQAGRDFLQTTQGAAVAEGFKQVLVKTQLDHGVVDQVRKHLDAYIPNHATTPEPREPDFADAETVHAPEANPPVVKA